MDFWVTQTLNAVQFSMLLFLLSVGLTIIFGLMHFVNLAHSSLYGLGAFVGFSIVGITGSYLLGLLLAPMIVALVGIALYKLLIQKMRTHPPMSQVLLTLGLVFVFTDLFRLIWGDIPLGLAEPKMLQGQISLFGIAYPIYRLFMILVGLVVMFGLHLYLQRTNIGAIIRASVDNAAMAACLGINVEKIFFMAFCLGCLLAGLAGVIAAPLFALTPNLADDVLVITLIVVVIGGLGSFKGVIYGSFLIGFIESFGKIFAPQISSILVYLLLAAVLIFRPEGLFPNKKA